MKQYFKKHHYLEVAPFVISFLLGSTPGILSSPFAWFNQLVLFLAFICLLFGLRIQVKQSKWADQASEEIARLKHAHEHNDGYNQERLKRFRKGMGES